MKTFIMKRKNMSRKFANVTFSCFPGRLVIAADCELTLQCKNEWDMK